jgi:hypothetical protein
MRGSIILVCQSFFSTNMQVLIPSDRFSLIPRVVDVSLWWRV